MNKNTSGPWQVSSWYSDAGRYCGISNGVVGVAAVYGTGRVQTEANARLISAAPELLEALKDALFLIELEIADGKFVKEALVARSVIAKATGGDDLDDAIEDNGGRFTL